jgi:hypothetical protein
LRRSGKKSKRKKRKKEKRQGRKKTTKKTTSVSPYCQRKETPPSGISLGTAFFISSPVKRKITDGRSQKWQPSSGNKKK